MQVTENDDSSIQYALLNENILIAMGSTLHKQSSEATESRFRTTVFKMPNWIGLQHIVDIATYHLRYSHKV
jgi:hypothetical protein